MNTEQERAFIEWRTNHDPRKYPAERDAFMAGWDAGRAALTDAGQVQALLGRSLAVIQQYIDEIGGCDHSVGICCCELIHLAGDISAALAHGGEA